MVIKMHYKLVFYVPKSHVDVVKEAVFKAGAGRIGNYDCCSWQVLGMGQFRPLAGSQPFIGDTDIIESVEEFRVEMICIEQYLNPVVAALKNAHPYEEPAFDVWQLVTI